MTYLLDTNVVSELRRARAGRADPRVVGWATATPTLHQWISVITLHELEHGVCSAEHSDPAAGEVLRRWLEDDVLPAFDQRILPVDLHVARVSARCHVPDLKDLRDTLIAATAAVHGLTVVTRNSCHFARLPAPTFNPWT